MEWILVAAIGGKDRALGKDNQLLWHLPNDFKHFKSITTGSAVVMGRKTFESIGRLLPNRLNIIISRNKNLKIQGAQVFDSFEGAETFLKEQKNSKAFLIGGGQLYTEFIDHMNALELTEVHGDFEADTFFPKLDMENWTETNRSKNKKDERHAYDYDFVRYERRS